MKISNIDVAEFLKGNSYKTNREKSIEISKRPSVIKRHVKKKKETQQALTEINGNTNWSWYDEVKKRWENCPENIMTYYRGNEKTGKQIFEEADKLAKAFDVQGLKYEDQIVACMSNIPEMLVILLAASKCGLIVNCIGEDFDKDCIKDIFSKVPERKLFICSDDKYDAIKHLVDGFEEKVVISLTDSLEDGIDPYAHYDEQFKSFINNVPRLKTENPSIKSFSEYCDLAKQWNNLSLEQQNSINNRNGRDVLNSPFTITYTSGSTKLGWPKAIVHTNKPYISIARFHDPDLSRMPAMRNMRGLAHIPMHSNTNIASSISDVICQTCTTAFEPIYSEKFLPYSLVINKPGFVPATKSHLIETMKFYQEHPELGEEALAHIVNIVAVGEGTTKAEERYINSVMKQCSAGSKSLPKILAPTLSVAGGNCEHGGLFFTLFKSLREKIALTKQTREDYGMTPFQLVDMAVLKEDGTECDFEEYGRLVADSNCTMLEYFQNPEATKGFWCSDAYGRKWGDCNVWAAILKNGNIVMKGRYDSAIPLITGQTIPYFMISEKILEQPDIMSCELVKPDNEDALVAHIELIPGTTKDIDLVLAEAEIICQSSIAPEVEEKVLYRVRPHKKTYPLTKSGKRSVRMLEQEGIDEYCVKPVSNNNIIELIPGTEYLKSKKAKEQQKVNVKASK